MTGTTRGTGRPVPAANRGTNPTGHATTVPETYGQE